MKIQTIRHSLSHIMAAAVQELYPETCFGIGPAIENGFYYDLSTEAFGEGRLSAEDLPKIEAKMRELIKQDIAFKKKQVSKKEAKKIFKDQPYKLELLKEIEQDQVSVYESGDFVDLCRGPHIKSTKQINPDAFKLTKIAGAYWRGDENNPMLTRIYGVAFKTKKELEDFLKMQKEAMKRDHRKLGKKLDLFHFSPVAPGMPFWHPKGFIVFNELVDFWREQNRQAGYTEVKCPNLLNVSLWKQSGHFEHYKESMFFSKTKKGVFALRPMDCPGAILIYKTKVRSYRDLPMRLNELGTVFRNEKSGELHGLFRVQQITQDDAHLFVTERQVQKEVSAIIKMVSETYKMFDLDYKVVLSTRPEDYMGELKTWNRAERNLKEVLKNSKISYKINEGDGAFYGPKIDFWIEDSLGRNWQCGTIQLDFFMPERFDLEYIDENGRARRPVVIHRVIMGALERFIGILIEHYAGAFPFWLSPVQVSIIPVGFRHRKYAKQVKESLKEKRIRVVVRDEAETVSKKIRDGEIQKIPYMLVVGDKEVKTDSVRVRQRGKGDVGALRLEEFIKKLKKQQIKKRKSIF